MPAYIPGRFPVAEIIELPWGYPNAVVVAQVANDVITKFKPAELDPVHYLWVSGLGLPVMLSCEKPIRTLEDMKGMKMRSTGSTVKIMEALEAAPVSMPIVEVYDALRKGTADGTLSGADTLELFKLGEVTKYATIVHCIGYTGLDWKFMSHDTFNSLPTDIQQVFTEVSATYSLINGQAWDKGDAAGIEYAKGLGVEIIELSPEEQARWSALMKPIRDEFIPEKEAQGLPAKEIASFIEEGIKKYSK
jgi:TRAP-type C4-dicarboxylate transport system substrate-binding protein